MGNIEEFPGIVIDVINELGGFFIDVPSSWGVTLTPGSVIEFFQPSYNWD